MTKISDKLVNKPSTVFDRIIDVVEFVKTYGRAIALSKVFRLDNEEQGQILAMECIVRRMSFMQLAERYNWMHGKLSMKSETMLADFRTQGGGRHRELERTSDKAAIELSQNGESKTYEFSWEQALQEPFIYSRGRGVTEDDVIDLLEAGKPPKIQAKYRTPRSRMQMLWARVTSDAVRAMAPEITSGCYTPEEIGDFDGHDEPASGNGQPIDTSYSVEHECVPVSAESAKKNQADQDGDDTERATAQQTEEIRRLYVALNVPHEKQQAILAERNAQALRNLTSDQADELLKKLLALEEQHQATEESASESDDDERSESDPETTEADNTDPCTQTQIDEIKRAITIAQQSGCPEMASAVKRLLTNHSMEKLAELTMTDADRLLGTVNQKTVERVVELSLKGWEEIPF